MQLHVTASTHQRDHYRHCKTPALAAKLREREREKERAVRACVRARACVFVQTKY